MAFTSSNSEEWEYEYSSTETQTFYIPIDLANVPNLQVQPRSGRRPGHPTLLSSRLRALEASRGRLREAQGTARTNTASSANASDGEVDVDTQETNASNADGLQITGLHTQNPLIMYNGQLLSCDWTATVGTDMFFVKHRDVSEEEEVALSLNGVDLLGVGTAKLVAKVGRLRPSDDAIEQEGAVGEQTENGEAEAEVEKEDVTTQDGSAGEGEDGGAEVLVPEKRKRTDFLEKLNQAKIRRGDQNRLVATQTSEGVQLTTEPFGADQPADTTGAPQTVDDTPTGGA